MLIEFDLLFAILAFSIIMPVAMFNIISNQNAFMASMAASGSGIASNADAQKLVSQLGGELGNSSLSILADDMQYEGYAIAPYALSKRYSGQRARLVVIGGRIYGLQVQR